MAATVRDTMGMAKLEVFTLLLGQGGAAGRANEAFEQAYGRLVAAGAARPIDGAAEAVVRLQQAGLRVAFTTGFSPRTRQALLRSLGWEQLADLALSPADAGRGRPHPDMVLTALLRLQVSEVAAVAVAGDTASDMVAGRRAGASVVAGVLTGSDDRQRLAEAGATHVLGSVAELPDLLGR
jgi:phosphonatase-like hydrolase